MRLEVGPVWKNDATRVVYGVASPEGLSSADIERAAHDYLSRYELPPGVRLVESYTAPADMTIAGGSVAKGSWVLGTEITDPGVWARVQKGESVVYPTAEPITKENNMSTSNPTTTIDDTDAAAAAIGQLLAQFGDDLPDDLVARLTQVAGGDPAVAKAQGPTPASAGGGVPLTGAANPISSEARAAIGRAVSVLQPFAGGDARVAALVTKLQAIAGTVSKSEQIARELQQVDSAVAAVTKADGPMSPAARAQNARATREAEIACLREVDGNAEAWNRNRAA